MYLKMLPVVGSYVTLDFFLYAANFLKECLFIRIYIHYVCLELP